MSFKMVFESSKRPADDAAVEACILAALRGLNKKLGAGAKAPFTVKLEATIEVTPSA